MQISGPISAYVTKIGDRTLALFGDAHGSYDNMCSDLSFNNQLNDLFTSLPETKFDLFTETNYIEKGSYEEGPLGEVNRGVEKCNILMPKYNQARSPIEECHDNVWYHYMDLRNTNARLSLKRLFMRAYENRDKIDIDELRRIVTIFLEFKHDHDTVKFLDHLLRGGSNEGEHDSYERIRRSLLAVKDVKSYRCIIKTIGGAFS